jgi:hypothetical protein
MCVVTFRIVKFRQTLPDQTLVHTGITTKNKSVLPVRATFDFAESVPGVFKVLVPVLITYYSQKEQYRSYVDQNYQKPAISYKYGTGTSSFPP